MLGSRTPRSSPQFLRRISSLSFSSNLLATLLLCGATVLKATFSLKDAPCELNSIGFQDILSFYASSNDKERRKFKGNSTLCPNFKSLLALLNRCVTADSVIMLYGCLALIILSFLCSLLQLFANLNVNLRFMKTFRQRGTLDVCCGKISLLENQFSDILVFINCVCLGLMYWAASSVSQFQFQLLKNQFAIPPLTSIEETRYFIKNATKKLDALSISFAGGFYFVLLAGLASVVSFATQTLSRSTLALR